jgi:quinol monooxygenase YgiN
MHGVIRTYSGQGARELFDLLEASKSEVEEKLRKTKGFVSYTLLRSPDGGSTLTVCRDKAGTEESSATAREWIASNASSIKVGPPQVTEGSVIIHAT